MKERLHTQAETAVIHSSYDLPPTVRFVLLKLFEHFAYHRRRRHVAGEMPVRCWI